MNFLAHCLIGADAGSSAAESNPETLADPLSDMMIVGGFLGDFIKGRVPAEFPPPLATGVRLHRRVDAYSNQQAAIRTSCDRFPKPLRRIAPILVDIIADHMLARHWMRYHDSSLPMFTSRTYRLIGEHQQWLPEHGLRFLTYMEEVDLLASYADWQVLVRAMRSITRRLNKPELNAIMEATVAEILEDLEADFHIYFPDILSHARDWVRENPPLEVPGNVQPS